jgi:hypothetical protein
MTWYGIERLVSEQISTLAKITGVHMKLAVVWRDRDSFVDFVAVMILRSMTCTIEQWDWTGYCRPVGGFKAMKIP